MKLQTNNIQGTVGIVGRCGCGKTTLALQMAADVLKEGKDVIFFHLDDKPDQIKGLFREIRLPKKQNVGQLHVITKSVGLTTEGVLTRLYEVTNPENQPRRDVGLIIFDDFTLYSDYVRKDIIEKVKLWVENEDILAIFIIRTDIITHTSLRNSFDYVYFPTDGLNDNSFCYHRCHVSILKNRYGEDYGVFFDDEPKLEELTSYDGVNVAAYIY